MEWLAVLNDICLCICGLMASNAIEPVPEFWREREGGDDMGEEEEEEEVEVDMANKTDNTPINTTKTCTINQTEETQLVRRGGLTA